ncbi:hypothetical protein D3C87_58170 [compost metagenome]
MKKIFILLIVFAITSCKKQQSSDEEPRDYTQEVNAIIMQDKPFFDFDEVVHYEFPLSETEFLTLMQTENKTEKEKQLSLFFSDECPKTPKEIDNFCKVIELFKENKNLIAPNYITEMKQIFSEKKCNDISIAACAPIYRDIFIFRKKEKNIGIIKLCFDCSLSIASNDKAIIDCFGMNGEYSKLRKVLDANKPHN